jgi:RNA polymerase sigma factor (sigma-70 family)
MGKAATGSVLHHLRGLAAAADGGLADSALLERFLMQRDEAAFEALVRRHGPMVWGVCRRVLHDPHDAEDAFQATFLVLVRKAASIARRELLGNWLYGVAYNTGRAARAAARRRRAKEAKAVPRPQPAGEDAWQELRPVLDQEISRLPDKYRIPVVLCDLEGTSRRQAARKLGLAEGTFSSRLARARALLRRRLTRRGLGLTAGALATGLGGEATAALPPGLVASTVRAGTLVPAGPAAAGVISARAVALSEGVVRAMFLARLKVATVVVLIIAALSGGAELVYQTQAAEQPKALTAGEKESDKEKQPAAEKAEAPRSDKKQERILRWTIAFNTKDGHEYARQLEALGAKLAIPTKEPNHYRLICDLSKRPVTTTVEDVSKIDQVFLLETGQESIQRLMKELGLEGAPEHIVVFLPRFVEDELRRKELDFAHRPEKDIVETTFLVSRSKRGFDIQVTSQR